MKLRDLIEKERKRQGRSRYWLAQRAKSDGACDSPDPVYRYLAGKTDASATVVESLLRALNLAVVPKPEDD